MRYKFFLRTRFGLRVNDDNYCISRSYGGNLAALDTAEALLRVHIGVQQSGTSDFLVRTSVPAECPIVSANSVDRLVQIGTAGTSWYESGTEVTDRREPRENRQTSRAKSVY